MVNGLEIQKIDITLLEVDCIVNAANSSLTRGGGVCGAIFAAAGAAKLQRACSCMGFCPTGSAVITPGFGLKAKYIAHAVGPMWSGGQDGEPEKLYSCYQTALRLAADKGCHSIAFPLISSGIYGYPVERAWEVALRSITDYLKANAFSEMKVIMAVLDDAVAEMGRNLLQQYRKPAGKPHVRVCDMAAGKTVDGFYILQAAAVRTTAAGKRFLSATVGDRSGSIPVILWDYAGSLGSADDGKVAALRGRIAEFKGALQITLEDLHLASDSDVYDVSALVPVAPIDPDAMFSQILGLVDSMQDRDYQALSREFIRRFQKEFCSIPAAKSVHHSFLHGLLMHTGNMLKTADFLASLYPQIICRDLLLTGTLLHDFAKRDEFTFSSLGLATDYSVKGQLLGHLVMGAQDVARIAQELNIPEEKSLLLQHMLLSHHGKPEYGAAVVPLCAESELLSIIDMLDSRMEIYRENLEQTPLGEFSQRVFALDGHRIFHHYQSECE